MRAVALLGPHAKKHHVRPFELPEVNIFSGNELDPTDTPDAALIFGGDGTMHRHLGGLAARQIPSLIVPIGSANDFAQSIGVESYDIAKSAWQRFCAVGDNVRAVDLGTVLPLDPGLKPEEFKAGADAALKRSSTRPGSAAENGSDPRKRSSTPGPAADDNMDAAAARDASASPDRAPWAGESLETMHFVPDGPRRDLPQIGSRIMQSQLRRMTEAEREVSRIVYFTCIAGTGLDAVVNRKALKQSSWLRGHGGYVFALLQTLGAFQPPRITVAVEKQGQWRTAIDERGFLLAAGNGPQYGHGMRITHQARLDDGLLDLCFVREMSKLRLLRFFPIVYRGAHIGMNEVEYLPAARLRIFTDPVMEVFADGEYICTTPVEFGVRPGALRAILPASSLKSFGF